MGSMDLRRKTGIRVNDIIQSHLEEFSNQLNAASLAIHLAPSLTTNDRTTLLNIQAKLLDPAEKVFEFLSVINGKVRPELFIEALRKDKLHDLAEKLEKEYDMLTSESDKSSAKSCVSRSSENSLPSLSDYNLSLSSASSHSFSSLPILSSADSRASTARGAHSDTNESRADKENLLPSLTSVSLTSSLSASAAVSPRDNSVINKQVFKRSQSDAATSTGTDFTVSSRPIHIHGPVQSVLIGDRNVISVDNSGKSCQDCETDGDAESVRYEIITEEDSDHMMNGGEDMRSENTGEDETLIKRVDQSTAMNSPARVPGAHGGSERSSQDSSQRGSLGGDPPGHTSAPVGLLPRDQGRPSQEDNDQTVRGDSGEAWGTKRSMAASLGVNLRREDPVCEDEGETKVWKIGRVGEDDEDDNEDTEIFKSHKSDDNDTDTKLYKLERELCNTYACGSGVKVDETAKIHVDQDNQTLTSSEVGVGEGAVDTAGHVGEGTGLVSEGTGLVSEGAGHMYEGVGHVGEGARLVGEGTELVGEGAGHVGEGIGLVDEGTGHVGEGAGLVGEGAGLAGASKEGMMPNYNTQDSGVSSSDSLTSNETRDSFSDDSVIEHLSRQESESRADDNSKVLPSSSSEAETNNMNITIPLRDQLLNAVFSQIIDIVK